MNLPFLREIRIESPIEERVYQELRRLGISPTSQFLVDGFRIDLAYPDILLGIECDGAEWHSTDNQKQRDWWREKILTDLGWTIIRFTGSEIFKQIDDVIQKIKSMRFDLPDQKRRQKIRQERKELLDKHNNEQKKIEMYDWDDETKKIVDFEQEKELYEFDKKYV